MVNFYKCKKCETKFIAPQKIEAEKGHPTYVCPKCQSRNWGPLDWWSLSEFLSSRWVVSRVLFFIFCGFMKQS